MVSYIVATETDKGYEYKNFEAPVDIEEVKKYADDHYRELMARDDVAVYSVEIYERYRCY